MDLLILTRFISYVLILLIIVTLVIVIVRAVEKGSSTYLIKEDQVYLYKRDNEWKAPKGYCFVQPIKDRTRFGVDEEESCIGIVKHTDGVYSKGDLVGFTPFSTYEFVVDGKRLYRVMTQFITIKYEYEGNEEEYNPSWAESSRRTD